MIEYQRAHPDFFFQRLDETNRRILLWELKQHQKVAGRYYAKYATGRLALYDALTHPKLREFHIKELEGGYPRIIAIWPNGQGFFWAKGVQELYAVKVGHDLKAVRLELHGLQPYLSERVFADR